MAGISLRVVCALLATLRLGYNDNQPGKSMSSAGLHSGTSAVIRIILNLDMAWKLTITSLGSNNREQYPALNVLTNGNKYKIRFYSLRTILQTCLC